MIPHSKWKSMKEELEALLMILVLARFGAANRYVHISTRKIANILGFSQQSSSRIMRKMAERGYISRKVTSKGEEVKVTEKGLSIALKYYEELGEILKTISPETIVIRGIVATGLGEGRYYLMLNGYIKQFKEKLGFKPYPGTLNLKLKNLEDVVKKAKLLKTPGIIIEGFSDGIRTYGRVKAFKARINDLANNVAVVLPERTSHGFDILEVIAPFNIRKRLGLKDGDEVIVTVYLQ
ncbi:MAG: riboflavin kinase [Desulfurococcales archaeon ex4484_217_1]|nr:MAG: riboflavin kinase [Desulfurococcales archaeon ex4484_217_1]